MHRPLARPTLAKIKANGDRLGYFAASAPFSHAGTDKSPQGYSVELCQRIAASVQRELGLAQLRRLGSSRPGERIESVRAGRIDIECGTTSWSFSRQQLSTSA
jgi:ABC-type amino acid transport substrate-binding protein